MNLKKKWGGKRENSGRKKIENSNKLKTYSFNLSDDDLKIIESIDGKNKSEKLRNLIKQFKKT